MINLQFSAKILVKSRNVQIVRGVRKKNKYKKLFFVLRWKKKPPHLSESVIVGPLVSYYISIIYNYNVSHIQMFKKY